MGMRQLCRLIRPARPTPSDRLAPAHNVDMKTGMKRQAGTSSARSRPWQRPGAMVVGLSALTVAAVCGGSAPLAALTTPEDGPAPAAAPVPIDWGAGPGVDEATARRRLRARTAHTQPGSVPMGPADAGSVGVFGPAFTWPLIPIHTVLLPDGRVLSYGTKPDGTQSGLLHYSVWDPTLGTAPEAMQVLPNTTGTDVFCAGQALLPGSGGVLMVGGDRLVNGVRNFANNDVNIFRPDDNTLTRQPASMAYQRWYATVVTTTQGEQVVLGGRIDRNYTFSDGTPPTVDSFASTPEVYRSDTGWRTLSAAGSDRAYGADVVSWNYPRAWLAPDGRVVILTPRGEIHALDSSGAGRLTTLPGTLPRGRAILPAVMVAPGRILSLRMGTTASLVDLTGAAPVVASTGSPSLERQFGNATVLADGTVWANGGSSTGNDLVGAAYHSEVWDPATGQWHTAASAAMPRLYHAISMLMPDGTVLTGGGGAPGPVLNLNAEIYYPAYLYRTDGSGLPAERPVVTSAPTAGTWGQILKLTMATKRPVSRVSLVRFGAVTHAFNNDQRFQSLAFRQKGKGLQFQLPATAGDAPPGFYMLFVLDAAGVPSVARIVRLD